MASILENFQQVLTGGLSSRLCRRVLSFGVDLGSTVTKFVVLQRRGPHYKLQAWGLEQVPQVVDGDRGGLVGARPLVSDWKNLQAQWSKHGTPSPSLGVSISGPRVMIKRLEFPSMSETDVREHVKWELDRYISPEMGEVLWDLHFRISSSSTFSDKTQALLVVVQKEWVEKIMADFSGRGGGISFVDVDVFALVNMVTVSYGSEERWFLAHLGPSGLLLVLIHQGDVEWFRDVPFTEEWYGDLVDQIRSTQDQAGEERSVERSAQILWDPFVEEVIGHIQDALREQATSDALGSLAGIILSGGYAVVEGMEVKISEKLGLPVSRVNPFKSIEVPLDISQDPAFIQAVPLLGVAVGVALRGGMEP